MRLGPIVVIFTYSMSWLIIGAVVATMVAVILAAMLRVILFARVILAADRLLVAMPPVWLARRAARALVRRSLMVLAALVGALGPRKKFRQRTMSSGVKVAAAVGKVSGQSTS